MALPYEAVTRIMFGRKIRITPPPPWLIQTGNLQPERLAFASSFWTVRGAASCSRLHG
jgi:hypothetical protein